MNLLKRSIALLAATGTVLIGLPAAPASAATAVANPDTVWSPSSPLPVPVFTGWSPDGTGGLVATAKPNPYLIEPLGNDTFDDLSTLIVEVVSQPAVGTVTAPDTSGIVGWGNPDFAFTRPVALSELTTLRGGWDDTAYERLSPPVADSFTYRLCDRATPTDCSAPARVDLNYQVSAFYNVSTGGASRSLAMGSVRNWTVNPLAGIPAAEAAGITVEAGPQWPADAEQAFSADGNGEWTWRLNTAPTSDKSWGYEFLLKEDGVLVGRRTYTPQYFPHRSSSLNDDEYWVPLNTTTQLSPFANDVIGTAPNGPNGFWLASDGRGKTAPDVPDDSPIRGYPSTGLTATVPLPEGTIGGVVPPGILTNPGPATTVNFKSFQQPGTVTTSYTLCTNLPGANDPSLDCSTARITVHVGAAPEAAPDVARVEAGSEVIVDVLGNDKFTDNVDAPVTVEVLSVSDGATARVLDDNRRIAVEVPVSVPVDAVMLSYRLTDYTGTSTAQVRVDVTRAPVVDPPVVDPPVVDPPVVDPPVVPVVAPKARHDHNKVQVGDKVTIDALDNDTYQGHGEMLGNGWAIHTDEQTRLVKSGKGWSVSANHLGRMVVEVSPAFKGDQIRFRYGLIDDTNLSDTALVTIKVTRPVAKPPIIPAGGVFDLDNIQVVDEPVVAAPVLAATAADVAPAAGGQWMVMLAGWSLLAAAGVVLSRRRKAQAQREG